MSTMRAAPPTESSPKLAPPRRRPRRAARRVWVVGVALSLLIHILLILLLGRGTLEYDTADPTPRAETETPVADDALRVLAIRPTTRAAEEIDETEPVERQDPIPPELEPAPEPTTAADETADVETEPGSPDDERSALDVLTPRMGDERLWHRVDPPPEPELTDIQRARIRLYSRLGALNDSLALAAEGKRRATDWTIEDEDGGRWGLSPGKIHLGDVTIPLPFGFSPSPGRREEAADRRYKDEEIRRQAERHDIEETRSERTDSIRARRDRDRKKDEKSGDSKTGSSGGTQNDSRVPTPDR